MSLAHYALLAAQEAAIAANVASAPSPVLDFKFEDNTTNDGSYQGTVTTTGTATYVAGNGSGKAADFGTGKFENISIANSASILGGMAEATWMVDFKSSATPAKMTLLSSYGMIEIDTSTSDYIYLYFGTANKAFAAVGSFGSSLGLFGGSWKSIKVTYKTGELKVYVDGSLLGTNTSFTGNVLQSSYDFYIGKDIFGSNRPDGAIDNVKFYRAIV